MRRLQGWLTVHAYFAGWRLVRLLPERAAYRLFDVVADQAWRRRGRSVRQLEANLARVRPEAGPQQLRELSRAGLRSYLRYYCDAFRLPGWSTERRVSTVRTVGDEPVRAELAAGRSVVMFLGHLGNWDHAGAWSTTQLHQVTTVAERLRPEEVFAAFLEFRERLGMRIVPLTGSDVFRTLLVALRAGSDVHAAPGRPRPQPQRGRGAVLRRAGPDGGRARPPWPWPPVPRSTPCRSTTSAGRPAVTASSSPGTTACTRRRAGGGVNRSPR